MRLTEKYRPLRFEDVEGQDHAVRVISGYIKKGPVARDFLFAGSVGSGKTTLARIYGRALNCEQPTPTGSPCNSCPSCLGTAGYLGYHEYDVAGDAGSFEKIGNFLELYKNTPPRPGKFRIFCFDEAHHLTKAAAESLLKVVEDRPPDTAYCFATTEPERLPLALRSRLIPIQVRPLAPSAAVEWLRRFTKAENIDIEDDALKLIVGLKRGYPRDLLNALELVAADQPNVSLAAVRELFDVDHIDVLPRYFSALAVGDLELANELFFSWQESIAEKIRWILSFMTSVYYTEILRLRWTVDAAVEAIALSERQSVLTLWCDRLQLSDFSALRETWLEFITLLQGLQPNSDDSDLLAGLVVFQECLIERGMLATTKPADAQVTATAPSHFADVDCFQLDRALPAGLVAARMEPDGYLTTADVGCVIETASFLVQEYGVMFNAVLELTLTPLQPTDVDEFIRLIDQLGEELTAQAPGAIGGGSIRSVSRDGDIYLCRYALYAPGLDDQSSDHYAETVGSLKAWVKGWQPTKNILFSHNVRVLSSTAFRERHAFHWLAILNVLQILNPNLKGYDDDAAEWRPLYQLLGIPKSRLLPTGPIARHLVRCGGILEKNAMRSACANKMQAISAFRDRAWTVLRSRTSWELDEHKDRQATKQQRQRELLELKSKFASLPSRLEAEISALEASWPDDPRHRRRSYLFWWAR